jgi:hypothetical protein
MSEKQYICSEQTTSPDDNDGYTDYIDEAGVGILNPYWHSNESKNNDYIDVPQLQQPCLPDVASIMPQHWNDLCTRLRAAGQNITENHTSSMPLLPTWPNQNQNNNNTAQPSQYLQQLTNNNNYVWLPQSNNMYSYDINTNTRATKRHLAQHDCK